MVGLHGGSDASCCGLVSATSTWRTRLAAARAKPAGAAAAVVAVRLRREGTRPESTRRPSRTPRRRGFRRQWDRREGRRRRRSRSCSLACSPVRANLCPTSFSKRSSRGFEAPTSRPCVPRARQPVPPVRGGKACGSRRDAHRSCFLFHDDAVSHVGCCGGCDEERSVGFFRIFELHTYDTDRPIVLAV